MNNFRTIIPFILLLFLTACVSPDNKPGPASDVPDSTVKHDSQDSIVAEKPISKDTVIFLSFSDATEQSVYQRLGKKGPSITCNFEVKKPQNLIAIIIPDKTDCNVRFNQIVMPGGQTDGPFGRELKYKLTRKGKYQLIIGHNMMAGDPEICDFKLNVRLE